MQESVQGSVARVYHVFSVTFLRHILVNLMLDCHKATIHKASKVNVNVVDKLTTGQLISRKKVITYKKLIHSAVPSSCLFHNYHHV